MCKKRAKALFISLFSVVMKKRKKCFNRFEFIFEFFEKRTRFEIPRQLVCLDGKKRMMILVGGRLFLEKVGRKKPRKEDEETEKRRFS